MRTFTGFLLAAFVGMPWVSLKAEIHGQLINDADFNTFIKLQHECIYPDVHQELQALLYQSNNPPIDYPNGDPPTQYPNSNLPAETQQHIENLLNTPICDNSLEGSLLEDEFHAEPSEGNEHYPEMDPQNPYFAPAAANAPNLYQRLHAYANTGAAFVNIVPVTKAYNTFGFGAGPKFPVSGNGKTLAHPYFFKYEGKFKIENVATKDITVTIEGQKVEMGDDPNKASEIDDKAVFIERFDVKAGETSKEVVLTHNIEGKSFAKGISITGFGFGQKKFATVIVRIEFK